jgi:SAM-dependent methyltransferase
MAETNYESNTIELDWDERARSNALHYIRSDRRDWDLGSFFKSGEEDYQQLVVPRLSVLGLEPQGKTMLEVGCGVGRVTRSFAGRFASVYALDVSEEMLRRGRDLHADYDNIVWLHGDGTRFPQLADDSLDFVFSYLTLQHMPSTSVALGCVREILRVLKPGGAYCFQFNSNPNPTMNWKGRSIWGIIDRLRDPVFGLHVEYASRALASLLRLDPLAAGRTWHGAVLLPHEVLQAIWESGGVVRQVTGWASPLTWCYGYKMGVRTRGGADCV